jgi:catechol 2,3-dioxygenase-like lactoylglutathione lyase family enzyme
MKPAGIHHVSICVKNCDEARDFYCDVLGMTVLPRPDFGFGGYWLEVGGGQLHLMESDNVPAGSHHFALQVADLDDAVASIRARGVDVFPVDHTPGAGRQAFLHDPSGNFIELNQPEKDG